MVKIHLFDDFKPGKIYKFAGKCIFNSRMLKAHIGEYCIRVIHLVKVCSFRAFYMNAKKGAQNQAKQLC